MTVIVVEPETPSVAEIMLVPADNADARPEPLMVATAVLEEAQVTAPVKFCVEPSVYVPVAVNCWVVVAGVEGFAGVTAIETNSGAVTVNCAVPMIELSDAVMVTGPPGDTPFAKPLLAMVAMLVFDEDQVTEEVRSWVEPSE
jgi:hypothetical protein